MRYKIFLFISLAVLTIVIHVTLAWILPSEDFDMELYVLIGIYVFIATVYFLNQAEKSLLSIIRNYLILLIGLFAFHAFGGKQVYEVWPWKGFIEDVRKNCSEGQCEENGLEYTFPIIQRKVKIRLLEESWVNEEKFFIMYDDGREAAFDNELNLLYADDCSSCYED